MVAAAVSEYVRKINEINIYYDMKSFEHEEMANRQFKNNKIFLHVRCTGTRERKVGVLHPIQTSSARV